MSITLKSWSLSTYTPSSWVDFVVGTTKGETVRSLVISNSNVSTVTVKVQVTDASGVTQAILVPGLILATNTFSTIPIDIINLTGGQKIQVFADSESVSFYASGVSYS